MGPVGLRRAAGGDRVALSRDRAAAARLHQQGGGGRTTGLADRGAAGSDAGALVACVPAQPDRLRDQGGAPVPQEHRGDDGEASSREVAEVGEDGSGPAPIWWTPNS